MRANREEISVRKKSSNPVATSCSILAEFNILFAGSIRLPNTGGNTHQRRSFISHAHLCKSTAIRSNKLQAMFVENKITKATHAAQRMSRPTTQQSSLTWTSWSKTSSRGSSTRVQMMWVYMPWLQLRFDYDTTTIRLRRISRAPFDASKKWTYQFFVVVVS